MGRISVFFYLFLWVGFLFSARSSSEASGPFGVFFFCVRRCGYGGVFGAQYVSFFSMFFPAGFWPHGNAPCRLAMALRGSGYHGGGNTLGFFYAETDIQRMSGGAFPGYFIMAFGVSPGAVFGRQKIGIYFCAGRSPCIFYAARKKGIRDGVSIYGIRIGDTRERIGGNRSGYRGGYKGGRRLCRPHGAVRPCVSSPLMPFSY